MAISDRRYSLASRYGTKPTKPTPSVPRKPEGVHIEDWIESLHPTAPVVKPPKPSIWEKLRSMPEWDFQDALKWLSAPKAVDLYTPAEEAQKKYPWLSGKGQSPARHTIAEVGDTYLSLAEKYGADPTELMGLNDSSVVHAGDAVNIPEPNLWAMKPEQLALAEKAKQWWGEAQQTQIPETHPQSWSPPTPQPGQLRPEQLHPYYTDYNVNRYRYEHQATQEQAQRSAGENMAYAYGFTDAPRNEMYPSPGLYDRPEQVPPAPSVIGREQQANDLKKIPLPPSPSAFEAVNWLTGAGLTGTAMLSAGHQLRLDRPEYWDATGGREDVLKGMEQFVIAEFGTADGTIDWDAAIKQDPYIGGTLEKLGYHWMPDYGEGGEQGGYNYGGYNYPLPSYSQGYGGSRKPSSYSQPSSVGLVSWSI